jgi:hypothetical protein
MEKTRVNDESRKIGEGGGGKERAQSDTLFLSDSSMGICPKMGKAKKWGFCVARRHAQHGKKYLRSKRVTRNKTGNGWEDHRGEGL